jgi:hypothetical protein
MAELTRPNDNNTTSGTLGGVELTRRQTSMDRIDRPWSVGLKHLTGSLLRVKRFRQSILVFRRFKTVQINLSVS